MTSGLWVRPCQRKPIVGTWAHKPSANFMVLAIPHQPSPDITYCPQTYNFPPNEKLTKKATFEFRSGSVLRTIARTHDTFTFTRKKWKNHQIIIQRSACYSLWALCCDNCDFNCVTSEQQFRGANVCCVVLHRFHNRFSQSRRRPLLGPSWLKAPTSAFTFKTMLNGHWPHGK